MALVSLIKKTCLFIFLVLFVCTKLYAQTQPVNFIRDAQTEDFLFEIIKPLSVHAEINPDTIKLHLINDNKINAFVVDNNNLFINIGLITQIEDVSAVAGVIAHELGHIKGGHVVKRKELLEELKKDLLYGYTAGILSSVVLGPAGMITGSMLSNEYMKKYFLAYTRSQEKMADLYAAEFMKKNNWPNTGIINLLELLAKQENIIFDKADIYASSHPFSRDRINALREIDIKSNLAMSDKLEHEFNIIKVKLSAFTYILERLKADIYSEKLNDEQKKYLHSIIYYREGKLKESMNCLNNLIQKFPHDPYYYEFKAQILSEQGDIINSIKFYEKAYNLNKESMVILFQYNNMLFNHYQNKKEGDLNFIIDNYYKILEKEDQNSQIWRKLSIVYKYNDQEIMSKIVLIEEAIILNRIDVAKKLLSNIKIDKATDKEREYVEYLRKKIYL